MKKRSRSRTDGDWHNNDEHQGEDRPLPPTLRVALWLMVASAFAMGGYGIYGWFAQQLIPVVQRLAQPMPARPPLSAHVTVTAETTQPQQPTLTPNEKKSQTKLIGGSSPDASAAIANP